MGYNIYICVTVIVKKMKERITDAGNRMESKIAFRESYIHQKIGHRFKTEFISGCYGKRYITCFNILKLCPDFHYVQEQNIKRGSTILSYERNQNLILQFDSGDKFCCHIFGVITKEEGEELGKHLPKSIKYLKIVNGREAKGFEHILRYRKENIGLITLDFSYKIFVKTSFLLKNVVCLDLPALNFKQQFSSMLLKSSIYFPSLKKVMYLNDHNRCRRRHKHKKVRFIGFVESRCSINNNLMEIFGLNWETKVFVKAIVMCVSENEAKYLLHEIVKIGSATFGLISWFPRYNFLDLAFKQCTERRKTQNIF